LLFLFGLTLFLSGALLFVVEPMFAKMALPKLGGTPAVWNVCLVTYQALLLAGYAYSHQVAKRLIPRRTALIQVGLVLAAFFALPIRLPEMLGSSARYGPVVWLLMLLIVGVGLPFLVLSTYSSILQTWYASTSRAKVNDPYTLYSASNLGSALGLFSYPILMERNLGLAAQSRLWEWGYALLIALTAGCALTLWRAPQSTARGEVSETEIGPPPARVQELKWLALAFIPSSLMLGVTTALTTELPPIPLLWVLPLALYLLSFILVFAKKPVGYHGIFLEALPILLLVVAFPIASKTVLSPALAILLYLAVLFFACMACHGELALDRPSANYLTRFYLCLSIGGVLGGLFNAIVAPVIFKSVLEFPIVLFLLALAIAVLGSHGAKSSLHRFDFFLPAILGIGLAFVLVWLRSTAFKASPLTSFAIFAVPLLICFSFSRRPLRFALGLGALLLASGLYSGPYGRVLLTERSFFGVYRVSEDGGFRQLIHGSTIHGLQSTDPARSREPLAYYYETGPIGQVFRSPSIGPELREVAIVGLGAGSLSCYAEPWRHFTYYEIDPLVERIARDARFFTFLQDCSPGTGVVIGDARLSLRNADAHKYDLVIVDAFSSDTVPVHLVTREAIELYLTKLTGHGYLAFNISNRYLDLKPVLGELARDARLVSVVREDLQISPDELSRGKFVSTWVLMARSASDLSALASQQGWREIQLPSRSRLWTDDYSSIINIIHWN
jgi:spermidine synthase